MHMYILLSWNWQKSDWFSRACSFSTAHIPKLNAYLNTFPLKGVKSWRHWTYQTVKWVKKNKRSVYFSFKHTCWTNNSQTWHVSRRYKRSCEEMSNDAGSEETGNHHHIWLAFSTLLAASFNFPTKSWKQANTHGYLFSGNKKADKWE